MSFFITLRGHFSLFSRFFERKAQAKVGKFTFVSTKLASKRAIKSGGSYSRCDFQSFAIKSISAHASQARARAEIIPKRIVSFPSEEEPEYWYLGQDPSTVATNAILVVTRAKQNIVYTRFH